jgi:hypothetical protein
VIRPKVAAQNTKNRISFITFAAERNDRAGQFIGDKLEQIEGIVNLPASRQVCCNGHMNTPTIDALSYSGYRNAKTAKMERRIVSGAHFLWLVLQHVLPKGFRRARNFGFLHSNCKRSIALLHLLLKFDPGQAMAWFKKRAPILCTCCGAVMVIVKTQLRSIFRGAVPVPIVTQGAVTV